MIQPRTGVWRRSSLRHEIGCSMDRLANLRVGAASTDVAHVEIDLGIRRMWLLTEERSSGHDLARLAVPALRNRIVDPRDKNRMAAIGRDALDGRHGLPVGRADGNHTRSCKLAV